MAVSPRILLVEDDEDDYVLTREKLQVSFGTDVRLDWASTWEEGLAAIGDASHDVYLIDFRLGARTGLELVHAASERGCSRPIILLTGQNRPDIDREAMEAGAADYLVKGQVTADQLARSIRYGISQKLVESKLQDSERALQDRVADLERAQCRLEEQGADLVRLADDLKFASDEADAANRAKTEFLAAMSHELRTPLNAIIGFSEVIKEESFGPVGSSRYRDYAKDINDSGQHLLDLINDILDISKIESGMDELYDEPIHVPSIIDSILRLVRQRANQRKIEIVLDVAEQIPLLIADERKLKQILVNLLTNAVKFTGEGGKIAVKAWCHTKSGFVFQISDTGIGIAPEHIPKALSQFGQVDSDLSRQYEGTGLGLPLTKALVESHGGCLDLQSEVDVGTTATVRFPATRIQPAQQDMGTPDLKKRTVS